MRFKQLLIPIVLLVISMIASIGGASAQESFNDLDGALIKSPDSTAVYWVGPDNFRHAFPNERIYFSWYQDFSAVQEVTAEELASYPLGKNVLYRPGSRLIKIPSVPEVYAVEPFGLLRNLPSETVAEQLYGEDWSKKVDDIDISFFFDYTIGGTVEVINDKPIHPVGSVFEFAGQRYVSDLRTDGLWVIRPISGLAWIWNDFESLEKLPFPHAVLPAYLSKGASVLTPEAAFSCVYCSKELFQKRPIQSTERYDQGGLAIEAPTTFTVEFTDTSNELFDSPLRAVESTFGPNDQFAENLLVIRWFKQQFGDDVNQILEIRKELADTIYYSGPSLQYDNAQEIVVSQEDGILFRYVVFDMGSYFYEVQFTSAEYGVDVYMDVFDLMIDSLVFPAE